MKPYRTIQTARGAYALSPLLIQRLAYAAAWYTAKRDSMKDDVSEEGFVHCRFDFATARIRAEAAGEQARRRAWNLITQAERDWSGRRSTGVVEEVEKLKTDLIRFEEASIMAQREIRRGLESASNRTIQAVDRKVRQGEFMLTTATFVRDTATEAIVLWAGLATGGAGIGAKLARHLLVPVAQGFTKALWKYQDTENIGAAVAEGASTFTIALIPGGKSGEAGYWVLTITKSALEATTQAGISLIEGKGPLEAGLNGVVNAFGSEAVGRLKKALSTGGTALPVKMALSSQVPKSFLDESLATSAEKVIMGGGFGALAGWMAGDDGVARSAPRHPIAHPILTDLAIMGPDRCLPVRRYYAS